MNNKKIYIPANHDQPLMIESKIFEYGGIVGGGACLAWYQNLPVRNKDIDVWTYDFISYSNIHKHLISEMDMTKTFDSSHASTYTCNKYKTRIQLIKKQISSIDDLINNFDITVCQIATDGQSWYFTPEFIRDIKSKKLIVSNIHPLIIKRIMKYWTYGYTPSDETINLIVNDPSISWDYSNNNMSEYEGV
jgi:hypothetical protein